MSALEDALRESLAKQADSPPPVGDIANTVLARAAVARRRRVAGSSLAGLVLMVAGLTGILLLRTITNQGGHAVQLGGPPATTPALSPTINEVTVPYDYLIGAQLHADSGGTYSLSNLAHAVFRINAGWVYLDGRGSLMLQRTDGSAVGLNAGGSEMAVSPTGTTVAVLDRTKLRLTVVALPVQGEVTPRYWTTTLPAAVNIVAVMGHSVVLERRTGDTAQYQVWLGDSGAFKADWRGVGTIDRIYGERADHVTLVGSGMIGGHRCLMVIKLDGDRLSEQGVPFCTVDFSAGADGQVSPDGRHLILGRWSNAPAAGLVTLIDLTEMATEPSHCGPSRAEPVWTQRGFVLVDNGKVVTCPETLALDLQPSVPRGEVFTVVPLAS